ncbi:MAG: hypothetical protein AAF630_09625, partial [Cyanobacteria bacterium P01_C01_bin.38]
DDIRSYLFKLISWLSKYLFLRLFGISIIYIILFAFGLVSVLDSLLPVIIERIWRLGVILFCLIATVMIVDSFFNSNKQ